MTSALGPEAVWNAGGDAAADGVLATHPVISAVPFFVPTFVVVAVIIVIVWRDRRRPDEPGDGLDDPDGSGGLDGPGDAPADETGGGDEGTGAHGRAADRADEPPR